MKREEKLKICRFYHGEKTINNSKKKNNYWYEYFWIAEKDFVDGDEEENQELMNDFLDSEYAKMNTALPTGLLSQLYSVFTHLHQGERMNFETNFVPYYETSNIEVLPQTIRKY